MFSEDGNESVNMAKALTNIAGGLKAFNTEIDGVKWNQGMDKAVEFSSKLSEVAGKIPGTGGWLQKIIGETDYDKFGTGMKQLGLGIAAFNQAVSFVADADGNLTDTKINWQSKNNMLNIIEYIEQLAKIGESDALRTGGFLQTFFGDVNFEHFADGLKQLGTGIRDFYTEVTKEDANGNKCDFSKKDGLGESIESAIGFIKKLAEVGENDALRTGGFLRFFVGDVNWENFGKGIQQMGAGISGLYWNTYQIPEEALQPGSFGAKSKLGRIVDMIQELAETGKSLNGDGKWATGGLLSLFVGDQTPDFKKFGEGVGYLAEGLTSFYNALFKDVKGLDGTVTKHAINFDAAPIDKAIELAGKLATLGSGLEKDHGKLNPFFGTTDWKGFKEGISALGEGLVAFNTALTTADGLNITSSWDASMIGDAVACATQIAKLAEIPGLTRSVESWWSKGNMNAEAWTDFTGGVQKLGGALKGFSDELNVGSFDQNKIRQARLIMEGIVGLDPILDKTLGIGNLGEFVNKNPEDNRLVKLAKAVGYFATEIATVEFEDVTNLDGTLTNTGKAFEYLERFAGMAAIFTTDSQINGFSTFADHLGTFGSGLSEFLNALGAISGRTYDIDILTADTGDVLNNFSDLNGTVTDSDLTWSSEKLNSVITVAEGLSRVAANLSNLNNSTWGTNFKGGIKDLFAGLNEIAEEFKTSKFNSMEIADLATLASAIDTIVSKGVETINFSQTGASFTQRFINSITDCLSDYDASDLTYESSDGVSFGMSIVDALAAGLDDSEKVGSIKEKLTSLYTSLYNTFVEGDTTSPATMFRQIGGTIIDGIRIGMTSSGTGQNPVDDAKEAMTNLVYKPLIDTWTISWREEFEAIGKNMVYGIEMGINHKDPVEAACEAMRGVLQKIHTAATVVTKEHSPSRVYMQLGDYMTQGIGIGIEQHGADARKSMVSVLDGINVGATRALDVFNALVDDAFDVDSDPVIRPVVDLSNVTSSAASINGLLSGPHTIGPLTSGRLASSTGPVDTLASRISKLTSEATMSNQNSTYNDSINVGTMNIHDPMTAKAFFQQYEQYVASSRRGYGSHRLRTNH